MTTVICRRCSHQQEPVIDDDGWEADLWCPTCDLPLRLDEHPTRSRRQPARLGHAQLDRSVLDKPLRATPIDPR